MVSVYGGFVLTTGFTLSQGQKTKKIKEFKTVKKSIETLAILPTFVDVKAEDIDRTIINDTTFSNGSCDQVASEISNLLSEKYSIQMLKRHAPSLDVELELINLFGKLDQSGRSIQNIEVSNAILGIVKNEESRYCVLNFFGGTYKTLARYRQEERGLLPMAIAAAVFSMGSVIILPPSKGSYSILKTIVFDKTERKVIFYKNSSFVNANPKNDGTVERYVNSNFKTFYYK